MSDQRSPGEGMVGRVYRWRGGFWRGAGPRNVLIENVSPVALVLPDGNIVQPGERVVRTPEDSPRPAASRIPSRHGEIRVTLSGPQVGTWALDHESDDLSDRDAFIVASRPEYTVRMAGRHAYGPAQLDGTVCLILRVDRAEFANSFEAVQVALERLAGLPDARHLANASMSIEVIEGADRL